MGTDSRDFEAFMKRRTEAALAYVQGDGAALARIAARNSPATFFGPKGGYSQGAEAVSSTYAHGADAFEPGGETDLEILHQGASDGIGYWVGLQLAKAKLRGHSELAPMKLRVTEIFRREADTWKLIHRHADMLADEQADKEGGHPGQRGGRAEPQAEGRRS